MKLRNAVTALALAALLGGGTLPTAYHAPTAHAEERHIFQYASRATILPFDAEEDQAQPGKVTITNGNIILPPKIHIEGGAGNNLNVDSYRCDEGPRRDLTVQYILPEGAKLVHAPVATVIACDGFELDGDARRANIVMSAGEVTRVTGQSNGDARNIVFRGIPVKAKTQINGAEYTLEGQTKSFTARISAFFADNAPVYTTAAGLDHSDELLSLEGREQQITITNPAAEAPADPAPAPADPKPAPAPAPAPEPVDPAPVDPAPVDPKNNDSAAPNTESPKGNINTAPGNTDAAPAPADPAPAPADPKPAPAPAPAPAPGNDDAADPAPAPEDPETGNPAPAPAPEDPETGDPSPSDPKNNDSAAPSTESPKGNIDENEDSAAAPQNANENTTKVTDNKPAGTEMPKHPELAKTGVSAQISGALLSIFALLTVGSGLLFSRRYDSKN